MANWIITDSINLRHPTVNTQGTAAEVLMLPLDNKAHTWQVIVRDGDVDADLSGKSCYAYFARNDNAKVLVNGTITDNVCSVTLDSTCYAIPGFLRAVMILSDTDQTVAICEKTFRVNPALPGQTVDPGETMPSIEDLLAEIGAMRLATSEANAAVNAAQTATTDANTAAQTANTNANAAQTAANNANQATTAANTATTNANTAAQNANTKANAAQAAANDAYQAATAATAATDAAQTATDDANEAAQNANEAASTITTQIDRLDGMDRNQNARLTNIESVTEGFLYDEVADSDTAYSKTVPDKTLPYANLDMIGGKTLVWNQLVGQSSTQASYDSNGVHIVNNNDGTFTVSTDASGATADVSYQVATNNYSRATIDTFPRKGHKALIIGCPYGGSVTTYYIGTQYANWNDTGTGYASSGVLQTYTLGAFSIYIKNGTVISTPVKFSPMFFDLTQMFGAGNEPTAEEFRKMFPAYYYPYSEPTLMNFSADKVVSKGRNLATGIFTKSHLMSGAPLVGDDIITSPNTFEKYYGFGYVVDVSPNTTYTVAAETSNVAYKRIGFYKHMDDTNNSAKIIAFDYFDRINTKTFTTPAECHAVVIAYCVENANTATTIDNVQMVKGSDVGDYIPYFESTNDLSPLVSKYFPDGMRSAGDVYDSFEKDDVGKWWAVQRVGSVDMGAAQWRRYLFDTVYAFYTNIPDRVPISIIVNDKYFVSTRSGPSYLENGECVSTSNQTYVYVRDDAYDNAETFTASNTGSKILYKLATPIRTEVTDSFPYSIDVESGGTITFVNDQGDDYRMPLPNAETWKFNIEDDTVRYDTEQSLTDEQKITARNNIGAADKDEVIELNEDVSELQDDIEDIKRRLDSGDISVPDAPGSSIVEEKNAYHLRLAKIQYTDFEDSYWGTTPEEKARNIAKFDIHVSGSIDSNTLPIISRAKEINPNLKICAYISVASGRPSFDKDSNDLSKPWGWYTFRRDGSWDNEYASQFFPVYGVNLTVPFNKWQILQQIEEFAHVGGHKTGERELVDTYTWIDENGVSHTDNKYIDKWDGGTSYDGIFWDDVGFDHIIDEGTFFETDNSTSPIDSVKRQGFASRRDKYICINNFTHDRGMFVIPNGIGKEDLYDPAVSNENPDGLGSSLTENDYVFVESFLSMIGTANSVNWRNEVDRVKTYMDDWYDTVKAKVIVEDYGYPMMDKETLNQFTTYAMATCVALGVHYYSITNVDNSLYVPNVIDLPVPTDESDRKAHLTRPASDIVKYSYAENTLSVIRNSELTRGEVTKYSILNGIKLLLNGNRLYNAFVSAAESDAGLSDKLKELKTSIDESISDTKQSASIYNRLMIDDWSVDKLEYTKLITDEAFTEFAQGSQNRFVSDENVDVTYDVSERTITWTKNAADGNGMQSVPLDIRIDREHYGHTIEVGYAIRTTGTGVGAWLDMRLDGDLWFEDSADPAKGTSTLYPSRSDMSVRRRTLIDYGDRDYVPLQFIATWNSNCLSATIENFYVIDVDEFDMDVSKTEYTNLMPAYEPNIQLGANRSFIMLPGSNSKSFTIDFENGAQPYNDGDGAGWWLDKSIFTPGHTYELGIKDVERNSGSYAMKLNIRIGLGDDDYIRNTVEFHEKYSSKIFPEIKTYNRRFTIPEDAVLTNPLLEFASYYGDYNNQEGTKPRSIVVRDWYLYDCDEENVIIRGVTPSQTSIRICRVTDETLSKDIQNETLLNNALYLTDTGKIYLTDVNKSLVKTVCESSSETSYGYDAYAYVPSYATSPGRIVSICGNSIADGSYLRSAVCKTVSSSNGSTLSINSLMNSAFPNGMHSTSTVYDELNIREGKAYKRVGRVNVGSLDVYMFTINGHNWFKMVIPNLKSVDNDNEKVNIIVPNFTVMSANATTVDKKVFNENPGSNVVVFVDDTCASVADFKTNMANVYMCYELSEPTVTDVSGIIPNELLNITAPAGGYFKFGMDYPEWFTTRYIIEYDVSGNLSFTPKLGPVITWIDDDCDPSSIPGVKSLCDRLDIRCTFAHMSGLGANSVKTTLAEYQEEGYHITTHSHTHTRWYKNDGDDAKFTVKECEADLIRSMVSMRTSGFLDCDYLIAPGDSAHRDGIPSMVSRHAKAFVNSDTGPNFNTAYAPDLFHLRRTFIDRSSHSAAFYQAWIDKVIANKGWLILGTHSYNSTQYSSYFMEQVLTYAKNNGVEILPLNEAVQKFYGNYIAMQLK